MCLFLTKNMAIQFYIVSYNKKWVTTSWTYSNYLQLVHILFKHLIVIRFYFLLCCRRKNADLINDNLESFHLESSKFTKKNPNIGFKLFQLMTATFVFISPIISVSFGDL